MELPALSPRPGRRPLHRRRPYYLTHKAQEIGYHAKVDIYDPWIDIAEAEHEYGVTPLKAKPQANTYDAIILAVAHPEFLHLGAAGIHAFGKAEHVLYDVKSLLGKAEADGRL